MTVFPQIIARGVKRGGDYSREAIVSSFVHLKLCPKYVVLF